MLFSNSDSMYYGQDEKGILKHMDSVYAESITHNQSFWTQAEIDSRFESGDQTVWNELYGNLPIHQRKNFSFNRIRRVVNMISGHQRKNRKSTIVVPVDNGDAKTADQFTKILMHANRQDNILETISESFHGSLVTGMNLMQVWMDYRQDPVSGAIRVDNCPYNSFLIDPFFKKADLSDCNYVWKRNYLSKRVIASLIPSKVEELADLQANQGGGRDGKFQFMPENYSFSNKNLLAYDEFYYRDYRKQKMLIDSQTGETQEWKGQDDDQLALFLQTYPTITMIDQEVSTVKLAIVVEGRVLYDSSNPLGIDKYPFVPTMAYYRPELSDFSLRVQGVVRGLRDAQYLYNRRKVIELDILESQINSGIKYKENALVNPKDAFLSGQGRGLAIKEDALMSDVEQIMPPQVPPSMIEISKIMGQEIQEISGVNEELLGSATDDKAGILSMLRQGSGLSTLQGLFDNLDRSQKLLGGLMIDLIQANFTPGKVKRIVEEEPTAQFYNKSFGKYDAAIEDGLNTSTQRQMQFGQLLYLKEAGVPITTQDLLEASTLQNKDEIVKRAVEQEQQQAQMQQQQAQIEMQEQMARINLANARSQADEGLSQERATRSVSNIALAQERRMESVKDLEQAKLNKAKTLLELEELDINHLHKLLTISKMLGNDEAETAEESNPLQDYQSPLETLGN